LAELGPGIVPDIGLDLDRVALVLPDLLSKPKAADPSFVEQNRNSTKIPLVL